MEKLEIILESYSISDATIKIFGYCNSRSKRKTLKILEDNKIDPKIFDGRNKKIKYERIIKKCPICDKEFKTLLNNKKEKITCSVKCSNSLNPKRPKKDTNLIKKRNYKKREKSKHLKNCLLCGFEFNGSRKSKFCSDDCRIRNFRKLIKDRIEDGTFKGWQSRNIESYPESFFKNVLNNNSIKYEFNFPISKSILGISNDSSSYFLDFYIIKNGIKIDLEIDGRQHQMKERKESDNKRDNLLKDNNYLVYRIPWKSINSDKGKIYIKNQIDKFLDWYSKI